MRRELRLHQRFKGGDEGRVRQPYSCAYLVAPANAECLKSGNIIELAACKTLAIGLGEAKLGVYMARENTF